MRHFFILFLILIGFSSLGQFTPTSSINQAYKLKQDPWIADGSISDHAYDSVNNAVWFGGSFDKIQHRSYGLDWLDFDRTIPKELFPLIEGRIEKMISDGDNGFFIVGDFFQIGDSLRDFIAHFDSNYQLTSWKISILPDSSAYPIYDIHVGANNLYLFANQELFVVDKHTGEFLTWKVNVGSLGGNITSFAEIGNYLYVGGSFRDLTVQSENIPKIGLAQIDILSGSLTTWNSGFSAGNIIRAMRKDGNQLFIGGNFSQILGQPRSNLASLNVSNIEPILNNWNPDPNGLVTKLELSGNKIIVLGMFTSIAGQPRNRLALLQKNNLTLTAFNPGSGLVPNSDSNSSIAYFHEDKLIINFQASNVPIGDQLRSYVAVFDTTNFDLLDWNPKFLYFENMGLPNVRIFSLNGRLFGNGYSFMDEKFFHNLMVFDATTMEPSEIQPQFSFQGSIQSINRFGNYMVIKDQSSQIIFDLVNMVALPDPLYSTGKVLAIHNDYLYVESPGNYTFLIGNSGVARLSLPNLELDTLFIFQFNYLNSIVNPDCAIIKDSMIYLGGAFSSVNGVPRNGFAAINLNTYELDSLDLNIQGWSVRNIFLVDSLLYVVGDFSLVQNEARENFAAFNINTGRLTSWNPQSNLLIGYDVLFAELNNNYIYLNLMGFSAFRNIALPIFDNSPADFTVYNVSKYSGKNGRLFITGSFVTDDLNLDNTYSHQQGTIDFCENEFLEMVEIYLGESYIWHGESYNQTGTYYLTQTNPTGCDSVLILNLNVTNKFYVEHYQSACDSFFWQRTNLTYSQSGYYRDTVYGFIDTIHTLHLTIYESPQGTYFDTIYSIDTYTWYGNTYTSAGIYTTTQPSNVFCDSVLTLNLAHVPFYYDTIIENSCSNSYTWPFNNQTYYQNGLYSDTLFTSTADTIFFLQLTLAEPTVSIFDTLFNSFSFYNFNGTLLNQSGNYFDTLINNNGCDSVINLNLFVFQSIFDTLTVSSCGSYFWSVTSQIYTSTGLYQDTVITSTFDTLYVLNLTINSDPLLFISDTLESSIGIYDFYGTILSQPGIYNDTIPSSVGCDTIVELNLILRQPYYDTVNVTSCNSYFWETSGNVFLNSGLFSDTIFGQTVQDTIRVLNLTILQNDSTTINYTECGSYTWDLNNEVYTQSGIYTYTTSNVVGCDSVVTLNLTINPLVTTAVSNYTTAASIGNCDGSAFISISGEGEYSGVINGTISFTTNSTYLAQGLCSGINELVVTDHCGNVNSSFLIVASVSSQLYSNEFPDEIILDTVSTTVENCELNYNSIDTAYIVSIVVNGNNASVTWNVVDNNGDNFINVNYSLENGDGAYLLQLNIYCITKTDGNVFSAGETILFESGSVIQASVNDLSQLDLKLYPNPTSHEIFIEFNLPQLHYLLVDAQGREIMDGVVFNRTSIPLDNLLNGVYYIVFSSDRNTEVRSIVKQ